MERCGEWLLRDGMIVEAVVVFLRWSRLVHGRFWESFTAPPLFFSVSLLAKS